MGRVVGLNTGKHLIGDLKMDSANGLMCGKSNSCNDESTILYGTERMIMYGDLIVEIKRMSEDDAFTDVYAIDCNMDEEAF